MGAKIKVITPSISCERGVETGSARQSSLRGQYRARVNQTNTGTALVPLTLGKALERGDGVKRVIWVFLGTYIDSILNGNEVWKIGLEVNKTGLGSDF